MILQINDAFCKCCKGQTILLCCERCPIALAVWKCWFCIDCWWANANAWSLSNAFYHWNSIKLLLCKRRNDPMLWNATNSNENISNVGVFSLQIAWHFRFQCILFSLHFYTSTERNGRQKLFLSVSPFTTGCYCNIHDKWMSAFWISVFSSSMGWCNEFRLASL